MSKVVAHGPYERPDATSLNRGRRERIELRPPWPPCPYCGRRPASNRRPYVARFFADGSDFVGHKACYLELRYPDDPRLGHERHDIPVGGRR